MLRFHLVAARTGSGSSQRDRPPMFQACAVTAPAGPALPEPGTLRGERPDSEILRRLFRPIRSTSREPGDPVVKTPRHRGTDRPGPPLEIAAHKAKDAPS